ncbi:hypothetical protein BEWA_041570 [Theileria equi strain WA]|uniref:Uncharacterized protein n=1 Tax=Theileria equi strain WA TaxID=1537102 RepID=L1LFR6_THEEQ|nr:hypothetical protein BEWA_041570 [Theileria equi strain WA]EKX74119.1 hypothetical protein BEWA_041570 [Theileria equi strain WA]|eukprot:XP_004833571.1 hypothetical protein BEWA_041570 [Theileria equi strain WA]
MNKLIVNVQNKCRNTKRCKCRGNKSHISVRTGTLGVTKDYGYCTHEIHPTHTRTTQISTLFWQNIELERIGFSNLFDDSASVTVFYNRIYDDDPQLIKKPLLIRAKVNGNKIHWLENVGSYANKRWRRVDASESGNYPEEDKYSSNIEELEEELKALSCRLFVAHRIHIDFYQKSGYEIDCEICGEKLEIKVQQDPVKDADGYIKYSYTGEISDNSILVYKGRQLTFQKRLRYKTGYYLPIPVDKENFNGVSAYYWEGDSKLENPLLIEFSGENNISYWIENISTPDKEGKLKHDKWRPLPWRNNPPQELKNRLDILNCIYNGVVQINIGDPGDCHDKKHFLHSKRIYYLYSENYATYPVVFSYKYSSSLGASKPYNISEIYVENDRQIFPHYTLPFKNVIRLTAFVSPCFNKIPFLICVESGRRNNYKWYKRKHGNVWEHYPEFSGKPSDVKLKLGGVLTDTKSVLSIGNCDIITTADGVRLDIKQTPKNNQSDHTYQGEYGQDKKVSIFVTKSGEGLLPGFIRNSHKPPTISGTFVVDRTLKGGSKIGVTGLSNTKIPNVKDFFVYFWDANPDVPILLGVKENHQNDTKYYGTLGTNWGSGQVEDMTEQEAIDHQNCQKNQAIPIELTEPSSFKQFFPNKMSSCLTHKSVTRSSSGPTLPTEAEDYKVDSYNIPGNTKISRVTYNKHPTDIATTNEVISQLRIYKWKHGGTVPLIVEFVKGDQNGSIFFENLGKSPKYTEWRTINPDVAKEFYKDSSLQDTLTTKLDEINCRINEVVQLDISEKGGKYCHGLYSRHDKRIQVTKEKKPKYSGFIGYDHIPTRGQNNLKISSIYNGKTRQQVGGFHMPKEVSKVTVYFPDCDKASPVAIDIDNGRGHAWLKRVPVERTWKDVSSEINNKTVKEIQSILDTVRDSIDACNSEPPSPRFSNQQPFVSSQVPGLPPLKYDQDDKKFSWDDLIKDAEETGDKEKKEKIDDVIVMQEYEDEEVIEDQNINTLIKAPITVDGSPVNLYPTSVTISTFPTKLKAVKLHIPTVIIYIKKDVASQPYTYGRSADQKVKLTKEEKPDESGFYMITHEAYNNVPFTIKGVKYDDNGTDIPLSNLGIAKNDEIIHLAVWYWKGDVGRNKPLLIEILKENGEHIYRLNNDNLEWKALSLNDNDTSELLGEKLEQTLDDLNCRLNSAVVMDLTETISTAEALYCCNNHIGREKKVTVTKKEVLIGDEKFTEYYKHEINTKNKLAKIKYYPKDANNTSDPSQRKRISAKGLTFAIDGAVSVYVFYCDHKPVLIYVDSANQKKWYKRKDKNNHVWEEVSTNLSGTDPDNIKGCDDVNKIKGVLGNLGCTGLKNCDTANNGKNGSTVITTTISNPKATINLSENQKVKNGDTHTYQDSVSGKNVRVTRSSYPAGADFFKFIHTHNGPSFSLKQVQDDNQTISGTDSINEKVTSVSAYYWRYEKEGNKNPERALLVEIDDNTGTTTYYRNSRDGNWMSYVRKGTPGDGPSQAELDLLNCEINDVVQIDVSRIDGEYCHEDKDTDPKITHHKKVKVTDATPGENKLCMYKVFEHASSEGSFIISAFKKGGEVIVLGNLKSELPLSSVEKVVVYFCSNRTYNPLLIYIKKASGSEKWFHKPDNASGTWKSVGELNKDKTDSDYDSIVEFLDGLDSDCKPPTVTIDIYQRKQHKEPTTYGNPPSTIEVRAKELPGTTNFTEYVHTIHGRSGNYFTVKGFRYKSGDIREGFTKSMKYVTSVSVLYWKPLENPIRQDYIDKRGRPLLIKVTNKAPGILSTEKWYKNKDEVPGENYKWERVYPGLFTNLALENQLKLLNCRLNHAVVIDINAKPGGDSDDPGHYDACEENTLDLQHGETSMQVTKENSTSLRNYTVYTHTLAKFSGNGLFHVLSFKNDSQDISIGDTSYSSPILDVTEVKVYFCPQDEPKRPLLLYYKTSDPKFGSKKWWKSEDGNTWGKVVSLATSTEKDHVEVKKVLDGLPSKCKPKVTSTDSAHAERFADGASGLAAGAMTLGSILGTSSGTLAGAGGLTGLGLWAFKRSRGDPWVRQI